MHMHDALISPVVAGTAAVVSATLIAVSVRKIRTSSDSYTIPLMGVMGAFTLVAQMINFAIPGTGSSGHMIGAILLSAILGQWAGFLVLSSVIILQCLLFSDGGLLALGCNILNMGVFSCLVAYPLLFRPFMRFPASFGRLTLISCITCVFGLELGAFAVTIETYLSGVSALPFGTFLLFMLPIHFVIGIVEGMATASVLFFVQKQIPDILHTNNDTSHSSFRIFSTPVLIFLAGLAVIGIFAGDISSSLPDGLEWSILNTSSPSGSEFSFFGIILSIAIVLVIYILTAIISHKRQ